MILPPNPEALDPDAAAVAAVDPLLDVEQVCAAIRRKRAWLFTAARDGRFPPGHRLGARWRVWRASEVRAWLDKQCAQTEEAREAG